MIELERRDRWIRMADQQLCVHRASASKNKSCLKSLRVFVLRGCVPALRPMPDVNITHEPILGASTPQLNEVKRKRLKIKKLKWRRKRDSNPREPFDSNGFQDRRIQPLCHSSAFYLTCSIGLGRSRNLQRADVVAFCNSRCQLRSKTLTRVAIERGQSATRRRWGLCA